MHVYACARRFIRDLQGFLTLTKTFSTLRQNIEKCQILVSKIDFFRQK